MWQAQLTPIIPSLHIIHRHNQQQVLQGNSATWLANCAQPAAMLKNGMLHHAAIISAATISR
jgi:hypothetical protein